MKRSLNAVIAILMISCVALTSCATPAAPPAQPVAPAIATQAPAPATAAPVQVAPTDAPQPAASGESAFDWQKYKGTTIRIMLNQDNWTNYVQPWFPEFEQLTGIKLNVETYPEDQFRQKSVIELASGNGALDIFESSPPQEGLKYLQAGWYENLADYPKNASITDPNYKFDDFMPGTLSFETVEGQLIGLPTLLEIEMLFYRKDLFEAAGLPMPPKTLEEVEAAAKKLNAPDKEFYGITMRGKSAAAVTRFSAFLYNFGGDWLDKDRNPTINSPEAIEALTFYGNLLKNYGPPGSVNYHWAEVLALFQQGKAAMFTEGSGFYVPVEDTTKSAVAGKVGYAAFPAGPKGNIYTLTGWGLSMAKASKNKEAAWYFLQWATSPEIVKRLQIEKKVPGARQSVWDSPEAKGVYPDDWIEAFMVSSQNASKPDRPAVVAVSEVRDAIGQAIVTAVEGGDVKTAADKAASQMKEIMAKTE